MNIPTRWIKVFRDIQKNKTRSILVVLSIAVGVFAIGMTQNARIIIQRDLYDFYAATNPQSTTLYLTPFDADLVEAVESLPEIAQAEARRVEMAKVYRGDDIWSDIELTVVVDYSRVQIDRFTVEAGQHSPGDGQILLERMTAQLLNASLGDTVQIKLPGSTKNTDLIVSGIVHDIHKLPPKWLDVGAGYVSMNTLEKMDAGGYYNALSLVVAEQPTDKKHILQVARLVRDQVIQPAGYHVARIAPFISEPGKPWADNSIPGVLMVLTVIGGMCVLLGAGLVINTISALIAQQTKQIGILRSIGGLRRQVMLMYLTSIVFLSLCALIIAIPLGLLGARWMIGSISDEMNFQVTHVGLSLSVVLLQAAIGLLVPIGAAIIPILSGSSISVYNAIYQSGNIARVNRGSIDKILKKINRLSSPLILAVRNTFRRKTRLVFTLATLALAGATFMAAFSAHQSLRNEVLGMGRYYLFDVGMEIPDGADLQVVEGEARGMVEDGIVEGWYTTAVTVIAADQSESEEIELMAIPPNSSMIEPRLLGGRWLQMGDTDVVVVSEEFLDKVQRVQTGQAIVLRIDGVDRRFQVVGIVSSHLGGTRIYTSYESFTTWKGVPGQTNWVLVRVSPSVLQSGEAQSRLAARLQEHFKTAGLNVGDTETQYEEVVSNTSNFDILLSVLLLMAGLLALVGGMGLGGAMSLNILERTREIGVLRAVGASNASVRKIVLFEGIVIGLVSWLLSVLASIPVGWLLTDTVGQALLHTTVGYHISTLGIGLWLALIQFIAALSSLAPAQHAARLTVREVLAYE